MATTVVSEVKLPKTVQKTVEEANRVLAKSDAVLARLRMLQNRFGQASH